ncbi:uncharacterized protein BDZ99DRAFT_8733 [Mytilinidion resinicola]|uniref:Protein YAE1 n=1 Tax=Mytilinidion resinicola TaxID=574789 RepID=A0A6A6Z7P4_9PEZI|nr:uncharacterized protein BDZ99DRAFT_8733 [Mytilinidion resinicola]KAF2817086.1 hypothetical protein BDZ99DRAFT_8733 [Mytilinidion resinicola]
MFRDTDGDARSNFSTAFTATIPPYAPLGVSNNALDDIYGSAPASPTLSSHDPSAEHTELLNFQTHEALSDIPAIRRSHNTAGYREGVSTSKEKFIQEGFDEGYALGACLGQKVGYILGVLEGIVTALRRTASVSNGWKDARALLETARKDLRVEVLLGTQWVDGEGLWKWDVPGAETEGGVTFIEVADAHPILKSWVGNTEKIAREWSVDLEALQGREQEEQIES